jgi:diguanylate cyclase (GGDEF)-like protein
MTRDFLLKSSAANTKELAISISTSLQSLMLRRSPEEIQTTISRLGRNDPITKIFILNHEGRVAFSSDQAEIGKLFSRTEESCRGCHSAAGMIPASATAILHGRDADVQRNVTVIHNGPACYGCHAPQQRTNGKLIIDCSLASTNALTRGIGLVILASASLCLVIIFLVIPLLSRSFNRYIDQVVITNKEISMIYTIIESVSKSIDMEDLKTITLKLLAKTFAFEEVTIVLPLGNGRYRLVSRTRGEGEHRRQLEPDSMLSSAIGRWKAQDMHGKEVSDDLTTAYLPIGRGDILLTLVEIHSPQTPFSDEKLRFMDLIINSIAIAFENARLYSIAITDELTGLFTVRHFRSCLDRCQDLSERRGEQFTLLLIDIDNFKVVNDLHGHVIGDSVLKRVASSIAEADREGDMAFRYGGEEFAVLLPATGEAGGLLVAERIRSMVARAETKTGEAQIRTTVSVGLAVYSETAGTVRDLVLAADKALYTAKRAGKNCVVKYDQTIT